jgi:hypothetical protein
MDCIAFKKQVVEMLKLWLLHSSISTLFLLACPAMKMEQKQLWLVR